MSILTVERTFIQLGTIKLELFRSPDGTQCLSASGCERAIDATDRSIRSFLRSNSSYATAHRSHLKEHEKFAVVGSPTRISPMSIEFAVDFWLDKHHRGNPLATSLLLTLCEFKPYGFAHLQEYILREMRQKSILGKIKIKQVASESQIVANLQNALGGEREVPTDAGNIDLLTSLELIECKKTHCWKHAIGQVLIYGNYYPSHQKRVHLFGSCHESMRQIIQSHCDRLGIILTWETQGNRAVELALAT